MAIIKSTRTFEGGELSNRGGNYLKPGTRVMNFRDAKYSQGVYVFILGAYKEDSAGSGVWYKPFKVRDNFGMDSKEKFAVQPNCPVDYFANRIKTFAPDMAKTEKTKRDGKDVIIWPVFGRHQWRVLYNAAFFEDLASGIHVIDLPQHGGASAIDEYTKGKQPDGAENPMINDYESAYPVNIKMDPKAVGMPWKIVVNNSKGYRLDPKFADTDYLYNLDEVVSFPSKDDLIGKLRTIVPVDLFNKCMAGYSDGSVKVSFSSPVSDTDGLDLGAPPSMPRLQAQESTFMPVPNLPKSNKAGPTAVSPAFAMPKSQPSKAEELLLPDEDGDLPAPPVASTSTSAATMQMAKNFLSRPRVAA